MIGKKLVNKYVLVRTTSAGVHTGLLVEREGREVVLQDARRIWYWAGAATLSELASRGSSKPEECKVPAPVDEILLTEVIEIIPLSEEALRRLAAIPEWSA